MSPNERLNNIVLERTIEYNTTQPQLIPRQNNPTLPLRSRHMERKTEVHMAYSRAHMFLTSYHMSQLRYQFTNVNNYAVTCPCKN